MGKHRHCVAKRRKIQSFEETKLMLRAMKERLLKTRMAVAESLAAEVPVLTKDTAVTLIRFFRNPKWREVCEDWLEMMQEWLEDDKKRR